MAKFDFRHGMARRQSDSSGNPTFLLKSGAYVNLLVQPDPTVFMIAHFDEDYIYSENVSVPQAWGPFTNVTTWLYWDIDFVTGAISRNFTLLKPIVQSWAPPSPVNDQHWFDTDKVVQKVWNGSRWLEVLRVFACELTNGNVILPYPLGSQAGYDNTPTYAGFPLIDPQGHPVQKFRRDRRGQFVTTETPLAAQFSRNANFRVEAAISQAEAHENIPVHYCVAYNGYNSVLLARNTEATMPSIGIAAEDMYTGEVRSYITKGFVTNDVDWDWTGYPAGTPLYVGTTGQLTPVPPQLFSLQRMGIVVSRDTVFIDTQQIIHYDNLNGNLLPLQLDRSTGEVVAKEIAGKNPPGTTYAFGYVYVQAGSSQIWTIEHNAGTDKIAVQIYDTVNEQVFPNNVTILDVNTVQIDFFSDQDGRAHIFLFT